MVSPIDEQQALLQLVVDRLDAESITYMVSGSLASSLHGEPRMTRDIDLVVDGTTDQLERFASSFDAAVHYITDPVEALRHRSMFTLVEVATGWKVDLMIRKDREFSRTELDRRQAAQIGSVNVLVVSPEDSVVSKLEWMKVSNSDRQLADVVGVLSANQDLLDWAYIRRWTAELGLDRQLEAALAALGAEL